MSPASPYSYYRDMNRILDRVYRAELCPRVSPPQASTAYDLVRAREGAQALEDSLQGLRDLRERSQGLTALREEIEDLRQQIMMLRCMSAEITLLRLKLAEPVSPTASCAQLPLPQQSPDEGMDERRSDPDSGILAATTAADDRQS